MLTYPCRCEYMSYLPAEVKVSRNWLDGAMAWGIEASRFGSGNRRVEWCCH